MSDQPPVHAVQSGQAVDPVDRKGAAAAMKAARPAGREHPAARVIWAAAHKRAAKIIESHHGLSLSYDNKPERLASTAAELDELYANAAAIALALPAWHGPASACGEAPARGEAGAQHHHSHHHEGDGIGLLGAGLIAAVAYNAGEDAGEAAADDCGGDFDDE